MARNVNTLTDEQVEMEIERISNTEAYKIAKAEQAYKYRRRQTLYTMRWHENRGNELLRQGKTLEDFRGGTEE